MSRNVVAALLGAAVILFLASPAFAGLCPKCKGRMYIQNIGKCVECGGRTSSGAFKLCGKCSAKLGQCEHCRAPLKAPAPANTVALGEDANGKTVAAKVGQTVVITLAGNPTTGYSWAVKKLDGDALKQQGKLNYVPKKVPRGMVGSGGAFVATFLAVKPGKTIITMAYARPWEEKKPPAKTFKATVEAKPAATK